MGFAGSGAVDHELGVAGEIVESVVGVEPGELHPCDVRGDEAVDQLEDDPTVVATAAVERDRVFVAGRPRLRSRPAASKGL